jgi:ketosteroid isomerase-like protein
MSHASSPEDCDRLFGERFNRQDVDGLVALYESDAVLVGQEGPASGTAAIRAALSGFVSPLLDMAMHVTRIVQAGEDLAVLYNEWTLRQRETAGGPATKVLGRGKAIEVVRRQPDGTWRFVVDDPFAGGFTAG